LRNISLLVGILLATPVLANAWTLTLKVAGANGATGNNITVTGGASRVHTGGTYTLYPTGTANVAINTATGYTHTAIVDGQSNAATSFSWNSGSHTVDVSYAAPPPNDVTITTPGGGNISILLPNGTSSFTGATGVAVGTSLPITLAANSDYTIASYSINGLVTNYNGILPGEVLTIPYAMNAAPVPNTITGSFSFVPNLTATLSAPLNGLTTQAIYCTGQATSNDTGILYTFTVTGKPAGSNVSLTPQGPGSGQSISFVPDLIGSYTVRMDVTTAHGASASQTAIIPVTSYVDYLTGQCTSCHSSSFPAVVASYYASPHNHRISCQDCHTNTTPHSILPTSAVCGTCHFDSNGKVPGHVFDISSNPCLSCHDPHSTVGSASTIGPHYNNMTGAGYPASYVTSRSDCSDCHFDSPANVAIRKDWAGSGHADTAAAAWTSSDFKTISGCAQCHTTTGFIAYSSGKVTSAWGAASDKTKEVLSCKGCHSNIGTGALRSNLPVAPYAGDSYRNPDLGTASNLCAKCHSGTQSGRSIKAQAAAGANFANLPFIGSHSSAAVGILFKSIGYEFGARDYSNGWHFKHDRIGINHFKAYGFDTGSDGPCAGCHMSSPNQHTFSPLAKDESGAVSAIISSSCAGCHTGAAYLDAARVNARINKYALTLLALQKVLEGKGIYYAEAAPYFFKSANNASPGNAVTNWGTADTMGAAFNFSLLRHEPGAYAHNMVYAKRLIYDSIDCLDNGALDNSVAATLDNLTGWTAEQKSTVKGYLTPSGARP